MIDIEIELLIEKLRTIARQLYTKQINRQIASEEIERAVKQLEKLKGEC